MDKISVIIRNRNEERYIGYAIQSVLNLFNKPEIIVVDNNSTDDSLEIVKSFNFSDIEIYNIDIFLILIRYWNGVLKVFLEDT